MKSGAVCQTKSSRSGHLIEKRRQSAAGYTHPTEAASRLRHTDPRDFVWFPQQDRNVLPPTLHFH